MGNRALRIRDEIAVPGRVVKTATVTLKAHERFVRCQPAATMTVTLPPVSECEGMTFTVFNTDGTYTVTVTSTDGQFDTFTSLSGTDDGIALFCDGFAWYQIGAQT